MAKYTHFKKKEGKKEKRETGGGRQKKKKKQQEGKTERIFVKKTRSYVFSFNFMVLRRDPLIQSIQMF